MLCVYSPDCTDFSGNGIGTIAPSSALVKETLNGEYELEIVHPLDETGKWQRLVEGYIVRAPVPAAMTPQVKLAPQTSTSGMVYKVSTNRDPLRLRSGTGTKYKILGRYKKGTQVIVLAKTTSSWYEVTCPDGKHGYMSASYLTYVKTLPAPTQAASEVVESRQLRDQPFRIYRVVPELDKVTAYARHVFYDLLDNMIRKLEPASTDTGASVIQSLSSGCLSEHDFTFYSDLTSTAEEVSLENNNPVDCLLGNDGIIEKYGGELQRDWFDAFVVERVGSDTNIQIRQGKNLTGIKYDVDMTDVVTRIMPTGEDKDGKVLYLPEVYIDSPHLADYPAPKWIHLAVSNCKEVTKGNKKKTKAKCYTQMREATQAEFDKGCDLPTVTLTVEFIDVTQTEEYRQYSFLQSIFLGDAVRVIAKRIGVEVSMRMTAYTYNCLTRQYEKMTLGSVADTVGASLISARQLPSGVISGSKLALGSVGIGQLQDGSVGELQIQEAAIGNAHIQNAAIGAANIQTAAIEFAHIAAATINSLNTGALEATTAKIASLTASDIQTDTLAAALAAFTVITCGTASFDAATIRHLVTNSMNLEYGAAGQVFIQNLAVEYAQMVGASIGNLCIKASNGQYYTIDVDGSGNVTATLTSVSQEEIEAGETDAGRVILETSITAAQLSTSDLLATFALVNQIDAARIDVDQLFARQAFIDQLNTSVIQSQDFIQLVVGTVDDTVEDAVEEISASVSQAQSTADAAQSAASSAQSAASSAQSAASSAQSTAASAQSAASSAQSAAAQAQAAAERALSSTEVIVGTQTASTSAWTGQASFNTLTDGQVILYWLPYAATSLSVTLNLTLPDGSTTGPIDVYIDGSTRCSTHISAGNMVQMVYRENVPQVLFSVTGWWITRARNDNTYDRVRFNNAIKAKSAVTIGYIVVGDTSGYFHLAAGAAFNVNLPILYTQSSIAANATGSNNYLSFPGCTLRNNAGSSWTGTQYTTVYIAGTLNGNTFTVANSSWLTTAPSDTSLTYISLGYMYSTYQMYLYPEHPMFRIVNGVLTAISQLAYDAHIEAQDAQDTADEALDAAQQALSNTEVIVGTQTAATGAWTGVASFSELKDGQQIVYWLPYAGSGSATLNLTLSGGGTTGAKNVYYSGATRLSTHYAAGNAIHLTYRVNANINGSSYTGWWADANYNSNYYDRMMLANAIKAKTAISASRLIVGDSGGYFHLVAGSIFDVDKPMLWAGSAITAAATGTNNYLSYPSCTLRNNAGSSWTATQYSTLYLAGTLTGNSFVVASENWLTTAPANETLTYIAMGYMYSTYQMYFYPEHPMYRLVDGVLTAVTQIAYEAQVAATTAQATAEAARADFKRVVRIDNDGLHVGDNQSTGEVLIDSESVNIVMNGSKYSRFAGNYVQFGNYQLRRTTDGGLAFKMTDI